MFASLNSPLVTDVFIGFTTPDAFQELIRRLNSKLYISNRREYFEGMLCSFDYLNRMLLIYRTIHITYRKNRL